MAKTEITAWIHEPVTALLSSRAKVAVIRILSRAADPLAYREVVRRSGMAYRSIELALLDLTATGLIRELSGGRERRVELVRGHRLAPPLVALYQAEADFFASVRVELRTWAHSLAGSGLLSASIVGPASRREETLGEGLQLVVVADNTGAVQRCRQRFGPVADLLQGRFGVAVTLIGYDLAAARAMWRAPTATTLRDVRDAELLEGTPLEDLLGSGDAPAGHPG